MPEETKTKQQRVQTIDPFGDDLRMFETTVARAIHSQMNGLTDEAKVEVDQSVIDYYNPHGMGGAKYFVYKGVKVYPTGEMDAIDEEESIHTNDKMHGTSGGKIL